MAGQPTQGFAGLLRQLRDEAGLTQEQLAEAATLSPRSISDLERGITRTPRHETARLLADALELTGSNRARFEAAARGRLPGPAALATGDGRGEPATVIHTLPRDIAGFTGRAAELERLLSELGDAALGGGVVGICAIGGMAGIGKTTLAVHAAHQLADGFPDGQLFIPLHAHTPGQRPVESADALASLLLAAGFAASQIPASLGARADCWRDHLAGKRVLLVLDDAAGHEQVRPLLPGAAGCLVLITSRRRLAALEDAEVISLDTLTPGEAADLLGRLAVRPDIRSDDIGVGKITRLCGYLPLAVGMLGRQLHHHPAWTAAGLAADLATAHEKLELLHAENLSVAAAFDLSYRDLSAGQRRLFRRLGLHPGSDTDARAAAALADTSLANATRQLEALYDLHLITEPTAGRYRMHDLIREHARALAANDDPATCQAAIARLLEYYVHTAAAAAEYIPGWTVTNGPLPGGPPPVLPAPMTTYQQAFAWLQTEHANLYAAAAYAAASGYHRQALAITTAMIGFLDLQGSWEHRAGLFQDTLTAAERTGDRPAQARACTLLASVQGMTHDYPGAAANATRALDLYRDLGDLTGQGDALIGLALLHRQEGDFPSATDNLQHALEIFRGLDDPLGRANVLKEHGMVRTLTGDYSAAAVLLRQALELYRRIGFSHGRGEALVGLAAVQRLTGEYAAATSTLRQAREVFEELGDHYWQAFALINVSAIQREAGNYTAAMASCQQALRFFRDLGERDGEACARNELGLIQQHTGEYAAAAASHQEALRVFHTLGERHEQAQALNNLGELASRTAASQRAHGFFSQALTLARDLGTALEEARALDGIGQVHLHDRNTRDGVARLEQALAIYRRLGVPRASRIEEILRSVPAGKAV